ncbi:TRAP transporter large permease subunit [Cytobacillus kochii]|uniref:TRAP transporter large permease subunit n=1 Tax=Cytobacillus kochii TaxID=859143 RepID=UPI0020409292|nr:TRAP transporter large permease subunit [Cytobacillus kochii]MCM3322584.1 TRAP transporter permease [Cytobacillus kochii]MCM3344937.1 TRAP transporter permease [Cytobacillus kochii]
MPAALWILLALLVFVAVFFVVFKRPMYEIMALTFVFIIAITGQWNKFLEYLLYPSTSSLFYVIFAFMVIAVLFDATNVVNRIVQIIISLVGRFRGGAGYVALLGSTFMASLSGTGPGNVATTGVFTIPMMKRTGFPPHFAATTEMSASMLGNIIPPAGIIVLTYGVLEKVSPGSITLSGWMVAAYSIGVWFFVQRWLTLYVLCRIYKVQPIPATEIPSFKKSLKSGWATLFIPIIIFLPLFLDAQAKDWLLGRLGESGSGAYSSSVLMFTPGLAGAYAVFIGRKSFAKRKEFLSKMLSTFSGSLQQVVPIAVTIYFAYATSQAFSGIAAEKAIEEWFVSLGLSITLLIIIIPIFFMALGMVLPGTAQVAILGGAVIAAASALGGDPILFAALLPAMTGALEGMTPPLALGMYVAMGIANSDFTKTVKLSIIWVILHLILCMILLTGILPILGL